MNGDSALPALSEAAIAAALASTTHGALARLRVVPETDSTNARLLAEAGRGSGIDVLLAERQTAGRGRRGRTWHSPGGAHIYLSLAVDLKRTPRELAPVTLVAGVACAEAIEAVTGLPIGLKWPNDLYLDGRKLGGILVETRGGSEDTTRIVVGVGVNVRMPDGAAEALTQPWADLATQGTPPDRNRLAAALIDALVAHLTRFEVEGFAPAAQAFARRDLLRDTRIDIHAGDTVETAWARGIDAEGALYVEGPLGTPWRRLHAGEVSVRR